MSANEHIALRQCPFCACPYPHVVVLPPDDLSRFSLKFMVVCDYREGGCGAATGWCATAQEAIEAWNQRKRKYE